MYNIEEYISDRHKTAALKAAAEHPGPEGFLLSAKIKLTSRCNLRCRMCGIWRYRSQTEMGAGCVLELIEQFGRMGVKKIHFSGGEPLLRPDLIDLLEKCRSLKIRANLTTNGSLMTKEKAKRMIRAGVRGISISIDGADSKTHDGIRGVAGAFKGATRAVELLAAARESSGRASRAKIRINTVIQKQNWRDLPAILALAAELGADEMRPMPVDSKHEANRLKKSELKDYNLCIAPEIKNAREKYGFSSDPLVVYPFGQTKRDLRYAIEGEYARGYYIDNPCYAPWLHMFVAWDGNVFPCCMMRGRVESLGNAEKDSVREIFASKGYSRLRKNFAQKRYTYCNKCDNFLHENNLLQEAINPAKGGATG